MLNHGLPFVLCGTLKYLLFDLFWDHAVPAKNSLHSNFSWIKQVSFFHYFFTFTFIFVRDFLFRLIIFYQL